jgi:hypothetical protein
MLLTPVLDTDHLPHAHGCVGMAIIKQQIIVPNAQPITGAFSAYYTAVQVTLVLV